jgi:hypothetical protein
MTHPCHPRTHFCFLLFGFCFSQLQCAGEVFERRGLDGGLVQRAEPGFVVDGFDGLAEAVGDAGKADFEGVEDGFLAGEDSAFLAAFLAAFLTALLS